MARRRSNSKLRLDRQCVLRMLPTPESLIAIALASTLAVLTLATAVTGIPIEKVGVMSLFVSFGVPMLALIPLGPWECNKSICETLCTCALWYVAHAALSGVVFWAGFALCLAAS